MISPRFFRILTVLVLLGHGSAALGAASCKNVFLIVSDGLRWQEIFRGADPALVNKTNGVKNPAETEKEFLAGGVEERRKTLLPFFWNEIAAHGQLLGNRDKGCPVQVTNGKKFSYPGYNEIITGRPDPAVDSNDKILNRNTNVFEWLAAKEGFRHRVAIFGTWDVFPYIFNIERNGLPVWPVFEKRWMNRRAEVTPLLNEILQDTTPIWGDVTVDAFLFHGARDFLTAKKPRVMFVGFGETDEWAHGGRYDQYLLSAQHVSAFIARLWQTAQSLPEYKDQTAFIITADHGRGEGPDWRHHGKDIAGAENDWIALLGPGIKPLGERTNLPPITHNQIAATLSDLLGEDFHKAFPETGTSFLEKLR